MFNNKLRQNPVVRNLFSLGLLQLTNYALPILFIPYIIRIVGIERYGLISLCQSVMLLISIVTDFGYNFTSTREVALNRNNTSLLSEIYSVTLTSKVILGIASLGILTICTILIPRVNENAVLFLSGFLIVIGQLLFPVWLFQGLEEMQYITYLNLFGKLMTLLSLLFFVRIPEDYLFVLPCFAIGPVVSSVAALWIVRKFFSLRFHSPTVQSIKTSLKNGFPIFISNVSVTAYSSSSILILASFTSDLVVGYYSTAEKIASALRQLLGVFSQAIYPTVCKLADEGISKLTTLWKKVIPAFLVFIFVLCSLIFIFASKISVFFTGQEVHSISFLIRLLAYTPFIVSLNIPSYQTLLAFNLKNECMFVLTLSSILNIILNLILSSQYGASGTAFSFLLTEVIISIGLFAMVIRSKKKLKFIVNEPL